MKDDAWEALERWAAKKRRAWEERRGRQPRPQEAEPPTEKRRLYHGRRQDEHFEPQIHTSLTPDDEAALHYALRASLVGDIYTVELDDDGLDIQESDWDWTDTVEDKYPEGMDVAIIDDIVNGLEHKTYLLLTDAAVAAVRVVDEESFHWWCVVARDEGCRGMLYRTEEAAFDGTERDTDEIMPSDECCSDHDDPDPGPEVTINWDKVPPSPCPDPLRGPEG